MAQPLEATDTHDADQVHDGRRDRIALRLEEKSQDRGKQEDGDRRDVVRAAPCRSRTRPNARGQRHRASVDARTACVSISAPDGVHMVEHWTICAVAWTVCGTKRDPHNLKWRRTHPRPMNLSSMLPFAPGNNDRPPALPAIRSRLAAAFSWLVCAADASVG
jgi:hypothetical protein